MSYQDESWADFLKQKNTQHQERLKQFDIKNLPLTSWSWVIASKKPRYDSKDMQYKEDVINGQVETQE